jgi:hypothetical protein
MKGLTIADTIGIFAVILAVFLFFFQIFPKILEMIVDFFSKTSADAVARQLAAFITVSGASPYKITITYMPTKEITYGIYSSNRLLLVSPNYQVSYAEKKFSAQPYGTPPDNFGFPNVNTFIITKTFSEGGSNYVFRAKKTE